MPFTEDTLEKSFDIDAELKYYKKVCKGKCKQYKDYVEWRSHIEHCVTNLNEKMELPNFKHQCTIQKRRSQYLLDVSGNLFVALAICEMSIVLGNPIYAENSTMGTVLWITLSCEVIIFVMGFYYKNSPSINFYTDILDIIEDYENKENQKTSLYAPIKIRRRRRSQSCHSPKTPLNRR